MFGMFFSRRGVYPTGKFFELYISLKSIFSSCLCVLEGDVSITYDFVYIGVVIQTA